MIVHCFDQEPEYGEWCYETEDLVDKDQLSQMRLDPVNTFVMHWLFPIHELERVPRRLAS